MRPSRLIPFALLAAASTASALDLGNTVFYGDSITQGGAGYASYRYEVWKYLVDNNVGHTFVGSQTGAYQNNAGTIPSYQGQTFSNVHDGHWGWRASWESGAVALPSGRYNTNNLGSGVLSNWLGLTNTYQVNGDSTGMTTTNISTATYSGATYTPDTAFILLGTNDIGSSGGPKDTTGDATYANISLMVQQLQQKNPNVRVYLLSVPPAASFTTTMQSAVSNLNASLAANNLSTGTSSVSYVDIRHGFDPASGASTHDGTHPSAQGQKVVANNIAAALGLGPRTVGLVRRDAAAFVTQRVTSLPGTTAGTALYRTGTGWSVGTGGTMALNASGGASVLQSNWAIASGATYSVEVELQMLAGGTNNNFVFWADDGTGGAVAGFLRVYADKTAWGYTGANAYTSVLDYNANTDGFHSFRLVYDGAAYQVWRDGMLIGESLAGSSAVAGSNKLLLGNYTSSETTAAIVKSVSIDTTGAYAAASLAAVPEPSAYGLMGAAGLAVAVFARRRRKAV